tara:strand:- start:328 stop:882 length:555 start_codon:yes stop_codon:yes gene_type:complete
MAWTKIGSGVLADWGSPTMTTTHSEFNFMLIFPINPSGTSAQNLTFNNSTGSDYSNRKNYNGGSEGSPTSEDSIEIGIASQVPNLMICYFNSTSGQEKIGMLYYTEQGSAPPVREYHFKYVPSSLTTSITNVKLVMNSQNYESRSAMFALGSTVDSNFVQDGAVYYETDTNKSYVLSGTTWSEL